MQTDRKTKTITQTEKKDGQLVSVSYIFVFSNPTVTKNLQNVKKTFETKILK